MRKTAFALLCMAPLAAHANLRITEFMYTGANGEFIEFTNIGGIAIDMTDWSFDDNSRVSGSFSLSAFGSVAPGESVILTEAPAETFRTNWGLGAGVKIIGGLDQNLGRNDEINLYDSLGQLVDRLTYGDQDFSGTIRTQNKSGNTLPANLGANAIATWTLSSLGDNFGSFASAGGDLGNPGSYNPVPEPATFMVLAAGVAALRRRR